MLAFLSNIAQTDRQTDKRNGSAGYGTT